ncbi:MAG: hypothetical protein RLZZ79_28 [Actinomycetota bacterium]|jgi:acetylglutamate kinase
MIVIKFGGHAMSGNPEWMAEIAARWSSGERFVVVHGGGPAIDAQLSKLGIKSQMKDGLRVTTPEIMDVVQAVLTGSVLREVIRNLKGAGLPAVGVTGADGDLLQVSQIADGRYGLVGKVDSVTPKLLMTLIENGFLPVVSPVSTDASGRVLNINADLAAGAIAGALEASQTLFLTDVPGIYRNWPDRSSLIEEISISELKGIQFEAGMIPKVEAVINAVESGAQSARILDGKSIAAFSDALTGRGGTWVRA